MRNKRVESHLQKEEESLRGRYRDLYGEGNYEKEMLDHIKKRRYTMALFFALLGALLGYCLHQSIVPTEGIVSKDGRLIAVERPETGGRTIAAKVYINTDQGTVVKSKQIYVGAYSEEVEEDRILGEETPEEKTLRSMEQTIRSINDEKSIRRVDMPTTLEDGSTLVFVEEKPTSWPLVLLACFIIGFYLYRSRFAEMDKKEKEARESVIRELPGFLNRFTLLLNAGLVPETAFERAMENMEYDTYFGGQMAYIRRRSKETGTLLYEEFKSFAKRSGVRELARLAGILSDNAARGTALSEKLKKEGSLLWFERKKQSEEKGRLAETKLTLPLAILLLVLVQITVAPALFEM